MDEPDSRDSCRSESSEESLLRWRRSSRPTESVLTAIGRPLSWRKGVFRI